MNKLKPIRMLLQKQNSSLQKLQYHAAALQQFEQDLRRQLPLQLAQSLLWQVGNLAENTLTLIIEHSGWATRMRFMQREILRHAQQIIPTITQVQLKIRRHSNGPNPKPPQRARRISPQGAQQISEFAATISDPELSAALERLGRHTEE